MRNRLAIALGRLAGWASRVSGRGAGTQISGRVALAIQPRLLAHLRGNDRVVAVSATNGKTTTTRFIVDALKAAGMSVVTNQTGANTASGITGALSAPHAPSIALLEIDELWLAHIVDSLEPELLVLGNLSRDQLDRTGEVRAIVSRWRAITDAAPHRKVVANASDPNVVFAAQPADVTWVALGIEWRGDAATCPQCSALLGWPNGHFACSACGFSEPHADYRVDGDQLRIGTRAIKLSLAVPGAWNLKNAALAATVAEAFFGIPAESAVAAIGRVEIVSGRFSKRRLTDGRDARVALAKNPAGWNEVLRWLAGSGGGGERRSGIVLAVNAHVADGRDTSWLYDVDFELLKGLNVVASGERALDVAVRLHYAGINCAVEPDPLKAALAVGGESVEIIASYTQFTKLTKRFW